MKKQIMWIIVLTMFILTGSYSKNNTNTEQITISTQMKEQILRSPFKAMLKTKDGNQFIAYLFAEDEKKERAHYNSRYGEGNLRSWIIREGHYFIYLYDVNNKSFLPYKTPILKDFGKLIFNNEGSRIVVLPGSQENQSDVLLISQFGSGEGDFYEAYGFFDNKPYLQNYMFIGKRKEIQFFGQVGESDNKTNSQLNAWGSLYGSTILSLSDKPGIILVRPKNPEK